MHIGSISLFTGAFSAALESFHRADANLWNAVEAVAEGDIIEAAMSLQEAKIAAKSGAAIAKVADEITGTLLDVLA